MDLEIRHRNGLESLQIRCHRVPINHLIKCRLQTPGAAAAHIARNEDFFFGAARLKRGPSLDHLVISAFRLEQDCDVDMFAM